MLTIALIGLDRSRREVAAKGLEDIGFRVYDSFESFRFSDITPQVITNIRDDFQLSILRSYGTVVLKLYSQINPRSDSDFFVDRSICDVGSNRTLHDTTIQAVQNYQLRMS